VRVLALETSGMAGSVAVLDDEELLSEIELDPARRTAQTLAPTVDHLLRHVGWTPAEVELVAVTQGPGSFTGLRIGVTTAKTFAYATGAAIIGVNTLSIIASQTPADDGLLSVVINAERNQLYAATFRLIDHVWEEVEPTRIIDNRVWLEGLKAGMQVSGPGLKSLIGQISPDIRLVAESDWTPRASTVGQTGLRLFHAGQTSQWWSLLPNYYRESAAVEKARTIKTDLSGTAS
jgi:tRNA threonylcarbamoyladenosine biosynthesis protein TsaB